MAENVIKDKSYQFALKAIKVYKALIDKNREYVLAKQFLRSATSIGANVEEAMGGQSNKDFIAKLSIAYKEARETKYWISLLRDTKYLSVNLAGNLLSDADELCKILSKIIITTKKKS